MKKSEEVNTPNSCLNKAYDNELIFVLLARDAAAPAAIKAWIEERVRLGLNKFGDAKLEEAFVCQLAMARDYREINNVIL